jgi:fatty-acyl-CoA synthase
VNLPLTPLDFLTRARRLFGPLEAAVEGQRRVTYGELAGRCYRLARLVSSLGVGPGDRVAYLCGNTLELLEAYYGVVLAGAVLTPLNIRLAPAEIETILADCTPALLAVHPSFADLAAKVDTAGVGVARLDLGAGYESALASFSDDPVEPTASLDENDVCELFYTSGSTGSPRGAMLTHRNLATHAVDAALSLGLTHRDVVLHTIPLFHVNGWGTPHYVTAVGARHVLLERFDAGRALALIETQRVTRCSLVPSMATALLTDRDLAKRDLSSLTQVTIGGAPPGPELMARVEAALASPDGRSGCEVICGYGLTEASPQVTKAVTLRSHDDLPAEEQRRRRATTGLPIMGVDARVLGPDDEEVPWDGSTVGEIGIRSNHVMAGYWGRPDETEEALRGGWLRTGDLAVVDAEGYITIVDRRKDLIISGGENISSVEVEHALCAHPSVLEAAVVGMADERWGEVPRAFVVLRVGPGPDVIGHDVAEETLIAWVRARLAHFKAPKRVDIVTELPKGGTGKVQKPLLRQWPLTE